MGTYGEQLHKTKKLFCGLVSSVLNKIKNAIFVLLSYKRSHAAHAFLVQVFSVHTSKAMARS